MVRAMNSFLRTAQNLRKLAKLIPMPSATQPESISCRAIRASELPG